MRGGFGFLEEAMFTAETIERLSALIESRLEEYREARMNLARAINEVTELEQRLADAELRVRVNLINNFGTLGRNAEERKLKVNDALANDPEVRELRASLKDATTRLEIRKAEAASVYMALKAAIARAEMFSSKDPDPDLTA